MAVIDQEIHERYAIYNSDNMEVLPDLKSGSIGLSIYSPPFMELYQYSNDPRDMSNCTTYDEGIEQYRFIVDQVHRLTMPGRLTCVHCMDLKKGGVFQRDFPGDIVRVHEAAGFHFFCRITIWKDPWLIARRTRMRSLMHKSLVNDSSMCRVAGPDYVLVFKRGGENAEPIRHPYGLKTYAGATPIPEELVARFANYKGDQRKNLLSHWIFRQYASPVWTDIRTGRLLSYSAAKENDEEKHVCALQLDVIERCLTLWSNPDEVVLSPFMGVGSEIAGALMNGRKGIGVELKKSYYVQAIRNIQAILDSKGEDQVGLFDSLQDEEEPDSDEADDEFARETVGEQD
jgi:hypothetical protein